MTIRDVSYFGWNEIKASSGDNDKTCAMLSGIMYYNNSTSPQSRNTWTIEKSIDGGKRWIRVDTLTDFSSSCNALAIDNSGAIYGVGFETVGSDKNWLIRKSSTGTSGTFITVDTLGSSVADSEALCIGIGPSNEVYVGGYQTVSGQNTNWIIRKSTTGASGTFTTVDSVNRNNQIDKCRAIAVNSGGAVWAAGSEKLTSAARDESWIIRSSSAGASSTFAYVDHVYSQTGFGDGAYALYILNNIIYCGGVSGSKWTIRGSVGGASGSFTSVDSAFSGGGDFVNPGGNGGAICLSIYSDSKNDIYAFGQTYSRKSC
jgi:hypothetical protein